MHLKSIKLSLKPGLHFKVFCIKFLSIAKGYYRATVVIWNATEDIDNL